MTESDTEAPKHPLDAFIPDPTGIPPLCDEPRFVAILDGMVADDAPRVFAIVQEYGERVDARIAAWGMAFDDRATVVGNRGGLWMSLESPDRALGAFAMGSHVHSRLVWVNPAAATPLDDEVE